MQTLDNVGKSFSGVLKNPLGAHHGVGGVHQRHGGSTKDVCTASWARQYKQLQNTIRVDFTTTNRQWWKLRQHPRWCRVMAQLRHNSRESVKADQYMQTVLGSIAFYIAEVQLGGVLVLVRVFL